MQDYYYILYILGAFIIFSLILVWFMNRGNKSALNFMDDIIDQFK